MISLVYYLFLYSSITRSTTARIHLNITSVTAKLHKNRPNGPDALRQPQVHGQLVLPEQLAQQRHLPTELQLLQYAKQQPAVPHHAHHDSVPTFVQYRESESIPRPPAHVPWIHFVNVPCEPLHTAGARGGGGGGAGQQCGGAKSGDDRRV